MTSVTQTSSGPEYRFATTRKQGDDWTEAFTIEGYASLAGHTWRAQVRGRARRLVATPGVSTTTVTVTTADDSVRVELNVNKAGMALLDPGVYVVDVEDVTDGHTWATGTLEVLEDWAHT